jgi:hypothetical protein
MGLEEAPAAFERGVLAVRGRGIREPNREGILRHQSDEPLHTLGPPAMLFRAIIQLENQRGDGREAITDRLPPLCEAIPQAVAGPLRGDPIEQPLLQGWEEEADRSHRGQRFTIVVSGIDLDTLLPTTGAGANFDNGFGIHRAPQDVGRCVSGSMPVGHLLEDGIGGRDFFCGGLWATFFGEYPRALRVVVRVCAVGNTSSV